MLSLYPPIKPYTYEQLSVDPIHTLYLEQSGNPRGLPVVFLHGGPGAGSQPEHRQFFNPDYYRIIVFDQRGCGRSEPHGELVNNDLPSLVSDLETIRQHLGIEQWVLFGGSWGSTLALVYAQTHPERVLYLILRGIFLCRSQDIAWFYEPGGASRLFPDAWEDFITPVKSRGRKKIIDAYYEQLTGNNELTRMAAAKAWSKWEGFCSTLKPSNRLIDSFVHPHMALSLARIEAHYFKHQCFLEHNQILKNADRLTNIPGIIVHGRYDCVCPLDNAYALSQAWPFSNLQIVQAAGHSSSEKAMTSMLVRATNAVLQVCR